MTIGFNNRLILEEVSPPCEMGNCTTEYTPDWDPTRDTYLDNVSLNYTGKRVPFLTVAGRFCNEINETTNMDNAAVLLELCTVVLN